MTGNDQRGRGWPSVEEVFDEKYGEGAWSEYKKTLGDKMNWFERTKLLRFSEKVRCCGYPLGLGKVAPDFRSELIARFRAQSEEMSLHEREQREEAMEALASAIDAERFCHQLPILTGDIRNRSAQIDEFASLLLMWLEYRGNTIVNRHSDHVKSDYS